MSKKKPRIVQFTVTGAMTVSGRSIRDLSGAICGYKLKDGTIVKLVVGLLVDSTNGEYRMASTGAEMRELGFEVFSYDRTDFEP